ncbi:MAG: hypothetical protein JSW64_06310 [Candidatus Zixiibacteriota bacterium]|nr:MAG: hypothetical protein JSW64_06310 [candidate division Zixibacteria bacterium]
MIKDNYLFRNKNVTAWVLLVLAMGLHVFDEAINNFLDFYNPLVFDLRDSLGFFPMPTFPLGLWLTGLIVAIAIGFALTPVVNRGSRFIRILTIVIGIIMIGNGLGHMLGSLYFERLLPGFWSSPFLLAAAVFVVVRGFRGSWQYKE